MRQRLQKAAEKIMREKDEARRKWREKPEPGVPLRVTTRSCLIMLQSYTWYFQCVQPCYIHNLY